jgi:hypothetical protein
MKPTEFIVENSIIAREADDMHRDHEVQMARSQLYSTAQAAIQIHRLLKNVSEMEGLEGWVQTKIAVASEYLESVQDYLKYEAVSQQPEMMPFAEAAANYALNTLVERKVREQAPAMTGHGQFTSKDMGGGTKVSFDPTTGGKSVTDADGTTDYNVQGKAIQQTSPTVGGFNKTTNLQTGATSTQSQGGPMSVNASTSTGPAGKVTSVGGTVPAPGQPDKNISVQSTTGAMLGGAQGKGNQVTMVTNPQGVRTGVIGGDAGSEATAIKAMKETNNKKLKEMATGGASSAGGMATSMSGPANKKTSGVPKRVGNAYKSKKVEVGKGVY